MWRESQGVPVQQRDETKECHKGSKSYMQEIGYNYSDTNICYPLIKMKNNFQRRIWAQNMEPSAQRGKS